MRTMQGNCAVMPNSAYLADDKIGKNGNENDRKPFNPLSQPMF